jgi:hypothetical protein
MKLDNETQRQKLLGLLSTVEFTVTAQTIQRTQVEIFGLMGAIEGAGLEKQVVPIESLAPDPPALKVERG